MGWVDGFGAQLASAGALPLAVRKLRELAGLLKRTDESAVEGYRLESVDGKKI